MKTMAFKRIFLTGIIFPVTFLGLCFNYAQALDYYIAVNGNDANPGTSASPFATLEKARDRIRQLKQNGQFNAPVNIYLRGGTYYLNKPFELFEADSGVQGKAITYQACPGENAIISGGKKITTGWNLYKLNGKSIYVANVGALRFNSLFVNGKRATRARTPNENAAVPYFKVAMAGLSDSRSAFYFKSGDLKSAWPNLNSIEIVASGQFFQPRLNIRMISANKVFFNSRAVLPFGTDYNALDRYYAENYLSGIDEPGEWYLDYNNGNLFYYPMAGENPNFCEFIIPVVDQLVKAGDYAGARNFVSLDFVEIPDFQDLEFGNESFSVSMWLQVGIDKEGEFLGKGSSGGRGYYSVYSRKTSFWEQELRFDISDGVNTFKSPIKITMEDDSKWIHFAWVINRANKTLKVYKNGVNAANVSIAGLGNISNSLPLLVGSVATLLPLQGPIDELRIFKKALDQNEVTELYNNNKCSKVDLVLHLPFENNVFDYSGKLNHGVVYGSPVFTAGKFGQCMKFSFSGGSFDGYVNYVNFKNLTFTYTDWHIPSPGYRGSQECNLLPATSALQLVTNYCIFEKNKITHTGGNALAGYSKNMNISANEFSDIGAGAIQLGEIPEEAYANSGKFERINLLINKNVIQDNIIHDIGRVHREAAGIFISTGSANTVIHNLIYNTGYSGISVGWWTNTLHNAAFSENNIGYNRIYNVMRDLNDGGAIYVLGKQPYTKIENNIIHDIVATNTHSYKHYIFGIYFDHAEGVKAENNVIFRTADSGIIFFQQSGQSGYANKDNIVRNNIFADGLIEQTFFNSYSNDSFQNNIIYSAKNPRSKLFYSNQKGIIGSSDKNLYFSASDPSTVPFYRFSNIQNADYFYTTSETEKNKLITLYSHVFNYEGIACRVFKAPAAGTVPLYRLYNKINGTHFYTVDIAEKNNLVNNYGHIFQYEMIACYVYPPATPAKDSLPVYRFWNKQKNNAHLYTASEGEKNKVNLLYPHVFKFEGIVFYAYADFEFQLKDWRRVTGLDANSIFGDPLFRNYSADDFSLLSNSPAFILGFQPINIDSAGPRQ